MDNIINIIFAIFSFAVILALAYFTSKFVAINSTKINNGKNMEIIDVLNLGNNKKILMIKILEKIYVVGISNNGEFSTIDTIENKNIINDLDKSTYTSPIFEDLLKNKLSFLSSKEKIENQSINKNENLSKLNSIRDKLKDLKATNSLNEKRDE